MADTLNCASCGTVLGVPAGGPPAAGVSCNWCGHINRAAPVPKPIEPEAAPLSPNMAFPPPLPKKAPAAPAVSAAPPTPAAVLPPRGVRWEQEDEDNTPYVLPEEQAKTRPCEKCGKKVDIHAVVCIHCGYDAEAKKKVKRVFQPVDYKLESGLPLPVRLMLLAGFQVANLLTLVIGWAISGSLLGAGAATLIFISMQVISVGTYEVVRITRDRQGKTHIRISFRFGFLPMSDREVRWRKNESVAIGGLDTGGFTDWVMVFFLFFFGGLIPAIIWWYVAINTNRFFTALTRDRGFADVYLYRGFSEKTAKEVAQVASDATGLPLDTPL